MTTNSSTGLSNGEVNRIVSQYIGGTGGYLADFDYPSLQAFYPEFCDLDIDPSEATGTNRDRFIHILKNAVPRVQAQIVRGILKKYPADSAVGRTQEIYEKIFSLADRLDGRMVTVHRSPSTTSMIAVEAALADAEALLQQRGPTSAIDRVHTSLHGYLLAACKKEGIECSADAPNTWLLKQLRTKHPALQDLGPRSKDIAIILNSCASILDAFNPIRNRASVAHPNDELIPQQEAMLIINVGRSLFNYLDRKLPHVEDRG